MWIFKRRAKESNIAKKKHLERRKDSEISSDSLKRYIKEKLIEIIKVFPNEKISKGRWQQY